MAQERIQSWIECIHRYIQEVVRLKGGNEYKEGKKDDIISKIRSYQSEERHERYERAKAGVKSGDIV